jgi:prephenate dehydratase
MTLEKIIAFKGAKSQTGIATSLRFPGLQFEGSNELFDDILVILENEKVLSILPAWNSHEGEILKTNIFEMLFAERIKIQEIWPKQIKFECIQRSSVKRKKKRVISVGVARTQCSHYLKGCDFEEAASTVDAVENFCKNNKIDAVLCPPGRYGEINKAGGFILAKKNVSNPFNFTTFALLGNVESNGWKGAKWKILRKHGLPKQTALFGVEMSIPEQALSEDQQELLDDIMQNAECIDELPKIIFICKRASSRCGMLIESDGIKVVAPIYEEGTMQDITIKKDLGITNKKYGENAIEFIREKFSKHVSADFIKHIGTQTCLYACPELNILTHGFEQEVVEKIVRRVINKYFELWDLGLLVTPRQKRFFKKHYENYKKKGSRFITFTEV